MHYTKTWSSILTGSLRKNPKARHVFMDICLICTPNGVLDMTFDAISGLTGVDEQEIREAIGFLEQPDPDSRRPDEGGRRLVRLDPNRSWGWRIVNFEYYRTLKVGDSPSAERMRRKRDRDRETPISDQPSHASRERHTRHASVTGDGCDDQLTHVTPGSRQKAVGRKQKPTTVAGGPLRACEASEAINSISPEQSLGLVEERVLVRLPLRDGTNHAVTERDAERFRASYPQLDITLELASMFEWCLSNPRERKTAVGIRRFIAGWLQRAARSSFAREPRPMARGPDRPSPEVAVVGSDVISEHLAGERRA